MIGSRNTRSISSIQPSASSPLASAAAGQVISSGVTLLSLPPEMVTRVIATLPTRMFSRMDCVSTDFHGPQALVEQALRLRFEWEGWEIPKTPGGRETSWTQALLQYLPENLHYPPVVQAAWSTPDAASVVGSAVQGREGDVGLQLMREAWEETGAWPAHVDSKAACIAALRGRRVYHTVASSPEEFNASDQLEHALGSTTGRCGPEMILYCWGGGNASMVGFPNLPDVEQGVDSIKADLELHKDTATLHLAQLGVFSADARYGNKMVDSTGPGMVFNGFHGASVRMLEAEQTFNAKNFEHCYPAVGAPPEITVTTQPGDLEVVLYLGSKGCGYARLYLMRQMSKYNESKMSRKAKILEDEQCYKQEQQHEAHAEEEEEEEEEDEDEDEDDEEEDEKSVMRRFEGSGEDWLSCMSLGYV